MTNRIAQLKAAYEAGDSGVMTIGWIVADMFAERVAEEIAAGDKRPALRPIMTNLLDDLCGIDNQPGELAEYYPNSAAARASVTDRLRVMRFFTRERKAELPGKFGFNHLRQCFVMGEWPDGDETAIMARVNWAIENGKDGRWATPQEILINFGEPENELENAIANAQKWCRKVADKSEVDDILRRACLIVANYQAGNGWAYDETQEEMEFEHDQR